MNTFTGPWFSTFLPLLTASAIAVAGVVDDLRTRKFHNWLFIVSCVVALVVMIATSGPIGLITALMGFGAGFAILFPLVLGKIVGAGDMKLLAAFGIVAGWNAVLSVAILGLIWGAIFGVLRTALRGQIKTLAYNLFSIVSLRERQGLELQTMPFTVAILMGWLSHLAISGVL